MIWIFMRYWLWIFLPWSLLEAYLEAKEMAARDREERERAA